MKDDEADGWRGAFSNARRLTRGAYVALAQVLPVPGTRCPDKRRREETYYRVDWQWQHAEAALPRALRKLCSARQRTFNMLSIEACREATTYRVVRRCALLPPRHVTFACSRQPPPQSFSAFHAICALAFACGHAV